MAVPFRLQEPPGAFVFLFGILKHLHLECIWTASLGTTCGPQPTASAQRKSQPHTRGAEVLGGHVALSAASLGALPEWRAAASAWSDHPVGLFRAFAVFLVLHLFCSALRLTTMDMDNSHWDDHSHLQTGAFPFPCDVFIRCFFHFQTAV